MNWTRMAGDHGKHGSKIDTVVLYGLARRGSYIYRDLSPHIRGRKLKPCGLCLGVLPMFGGGRGAAICVEEPTRVCWSSRSVGKRRSVVSVRGDYFLRMTDWK